MSALTDFRKAKDDFFRTDTSPLTPPQRREFEGLSYYDEAPELALRLHPEPFDEQIQVEMETSTGDTASYVRWGRITFEVGGEDAQLTLFRDAEGRFFLPFQDANAGGETYGAGRYLDLEADSDGSLLVDFNYAYNPYCAYNPHWSCPMPPFENKLAVAIRAGEKTFEGAEY